MLKPVRTLFVFLTLLLLVSRHEPAWAGGPDTSLGEEIQVSALKGVEEEDPVVGWDGTDYLVVWQSSRKDPNDYDVYGARVSPDGKVLDPGGFAISTAPSNQIFLDLAWGKGEYLAVWQDLRSHQRWEIYGARFRSDGTVLDPEGIPIAVGKRNARHPQVAWDGTNFLAVWMEENEGRGWDIAGARVSPEGKVIDNERMLIAQAPGDQAYPALAWGNDRYLVVWMEKGGISGAFVSPSGKVINPQGIVLTRSSHEAGFPSVAWGKEQFVVVWGEQPSPPVHTLAGVRVKPQGTVVDAKEFTIASSANLHTFPSVRCAETRCLVVWEEDKTVGRMQRIDDVVRDVRGAFLDLSKSAVIPDDVMILPRSIGNHFAKVASDGHHYLVVWKDYRSGTAASLGRLVIRAQ